MPRISTHMHFGKLLLESTDDDVDIRSFILGLVAPDTFTDDKTFDKYHCVDEDGDIDVKEFYEKFEWKKFNLKQKSFVLGYYSHLWLDEYCRFNTSKLTIHNKNDLIDEVLGHAVKNLITYYDLEIIGDFYEGIRDGISDYDLQLNIVELKDIDINKSKIMINDFFSEHIDEELNKELIEEDEYIDFFSKSSKKFLNSINS